MPSATPPKIVRITTVPQSLRGLLRGQLRYVNENGFQVVGVSSPGEALFDVAKNEGVEVVAVPMQRAISPIADILSLLRLIQLLIKEKPAIVHTHTPKAGLLGMMAAWITRVPVRMHTVAGMPLTVATGFKKRLLAWMEQLTYACATDVYPNSKGLAQIILQEKFTSPKKLHVIGHGSSNGIDLAHFDASLITAEERAQLRYKYGIAPDDFVYVFVGRLVGDKGINELISAFHSLPDSRMKLVLVGRFESDLDPLQPKTLQLIEADSRIVHVGYQTDVRPFFAFADVLVFPSYREGFPNVVMQAGAMGLPCIVSDINGCNEIVIQDKNGIIIPPKNEPDLREAMVRLAEDKLYFAHLKSHAREMIRTRYQQQTIWDQLLAIYITKAGQN